MTIALIANPKNAGALKELRRAVKTLRDAGHRVMPRLTFDDSDATRFARRASERNVDLIIAAGGDGTINEVVNGMIQAREPRPALAIVPLGTANDFAKGLEIPEDIHAAIDLAVHGGVAAVDVAAVNDRCFINVSTGGFGPDITDAASAKAKRRFGKLAYLFSAMKKLSSLEPFNAEFQAEGEVVYDGPFFFYAVGNARQTGGGTQVTPHADYSDARLDVAIVTGVKRRDFLKLLPDIRAGRHLDDADVLYLKTRNLVITARDDFAVNADGEPVSGRILQYRIRPERISVVRG